MMPHLKVRPNTISFNAMISSCEKAGQWQRLVLLVPMGFANVNGNCPSKCQTIFLVK